MYPQKKEIILYGIDKDLLKPYVPEIKIRMNKGKAYDVKNVSSSEDVYELLKRIYGRNPVQEHFVVLLFNRANKLIGFYKHTIGSTSATIVDVPMLVGIAVKALAHGVIISHNHPSGTKRPSDADKAITTDLSNALKTMRISLLDHIIFTSDGYYSFANEGILNGINTTDMITLDNILSQYPTIDQQILPKELNLEEFEFVKENIDLYDKDKDIKIFIDTFIEKLNQVVRKKAQPVEPVRPMAKNKPGKKKKEVLVKEKKVLPESEGTMVERIEPEVTFIKRYVNMHGKVKTKSQVLNLLKSLQKAITERVIRKTSPYAGEISDMQSNLVKLANAKASQFEIRIEAKSLDRLREIAGSEVIMPCVKLVKRFLIVQGKTGVKDKAKKLLDDIENTSMSPKEAIKHKIADIKKALRDYIASKTDAPETSLSVLNGLQSLAGFSGFDGIGSSNKPIREDMVISSAQLEKMTFQRMGFTGEWRELIGDPAEKFVTMIYGGPGSGKSTLALKFASYLVKNHGKKVLYIAHEEKVGDTVRDKLARLNAFHPNLFVVGRMPKELSGYDFLFIDSVNSHNLSPSEIERIMEKHPRLSIVYLCQTTKDGRFRGSKEWEHLTDVVICVENGVARPEKNRFGGKGYTKIFMNSPKKL